MLSSIKLLKSKAVQIYKRKPFSNLVTSRSEALLVPEYLKSRLLDGLIRIKGGLGLFVYLSSIRKLQGSALTKSDVKVIRRFCSDVCTLRRKSGLKFLVLYLKSSSTILQQSVSGYYVADIGQLGPRVSRTRKGLPRLIPAQHRLLIRKGRADIVQLWLSMFLLYRTLQFAGASPNLDTIKFGSGLPITFQDNWADFVGSFRRRIDPYVPKTWGPPKFFISTSSGPVERPPQGASFKVWNSSMGSIMKSGLYWLSSPNSHLVKFLEGQTQALKMLKNIQRFVSEGVRLGLPEMEKARYVGKLGFKDEAAGKVRVFAMVDIWTQWALKPFHNHVMSILRRIPQDGTFDQFRPVRQLLAKRPKYIASFDLSAATDALPIIFQTEVLASLIGKSLADIWAKLLTDREYSFYRKTTRNGVDHVIKGSVRYGVGQPMGALSSWAMLAITHHCIVQFSAWKAGVTKAGLWFADYAILGDDVVIANKEVADSYLIVMNQMAVKVGLHKSLISTNGSLEFAKRFVSKWVDASPIAIKEILAAQASANVAINLARKWNKGDLSSGLVTLGRALGFKHGRMGAISNPRVGTRLWEYVSAWWHPSNSGLSWLVWLFSKDFNYPWIPRELNNREQVLLTALLGSRLVVLQNQARKVARLLTVHPPQGAPTEWLEYLTPWLYKGTAFNKAAAMIIQLVYKPSARKGLLVVWEVESEMKKFKSFPSTGSFEKWEATCEQLFSWEERLSAVRTSWADQVGARGDTLDWLRTSRLRRAYWSSKRSFIKSKKLGWKKTNQV